jgi:prepilin-type N-terminal cleavage/methylation domain-containing protein
MTIQKSVPSDRSPRPDAASGFTLIELAIVIVIIGIVIATIATVLPTLIQSSKIKQAKAILEKTTYAIEGYLDANGRCPCPDTSGDGLENRNDNATPGDASDDTCSAYVGNLPYLTLGFSSGLDNWQNPIKYGVYEDLIRTSTSGLCASLATLAATAFDSTKLHTTDTGGNNSNQAYVVVSSGPKDLDTDASDGFFDGFNEGTDVQFDVPDRIEFHGTPTSSRYDDLVYAAAFTYLNGKLCTGGGGGGGGGIAGENTYPNGCANAVDDDGDTYIDCLDQDCFNVAPCGPGGSNVSITTGTIPSGTVNSDYLTQIQATGGITPYEWTLTNKGGFSNLFLHTYTGQLSGELDQCPGTYTIQVEVRDATLPADGGPTIDNRSLNIQVTSNLSISRTSGGGVNILWTSPTQQETFETVGSHLGNISWSLDTGGADGFTVSTTGSDACAVKKIGATTTGEGPYTFTLTANDMDCVASNSAQLLLTVTIPSSGTGSGAPYSADLIAEWRMDECSWNGTSGEVTDTGTNGLNGTAVNGLTTSAVGRICRAASVAASNQGILIPDDPLLNFTGSDWSIAFWYLMLENSSGAWDQIFVKGNGASRNYAMWLRPSSGRIHFRVDPSNQGLDSNAALIPGTWHFIAGIYAGGTLSLYIDGALDNTAAVTMNATSANTEPLYIGDSPNYSTIDAQIDEFMIFNKALSDPEIADLRALTRPGCSGACYTNAVASYRMDETAWNSSAGDVQDASGNGYHGTSYHGADTTDQGRICRGGAFTDSGDNLVNDRVSLPYAAGNGLQDFSVALWVRTGAGGQQAILSGANTLRDNEWLLFLPNGTSVSTYLRGSSKSYNVPAITDGAWHHLVWMREASREFFFVDGGLLGTNAVAGNALVISPNGLWLGSEQDSVGGGWAASQELIGTLDEVHIFDRALSSAEIEALRTENRTCN